ncbi:MAG: hypothetical protein FWC71_03760 [Defluviitaleaceae bacterium]|nr:hypothetical protein [Defluviitaleaceae bacterium]
MKKLIEFSIPLKAFAAMILAGILVLYMVSGVAYTLLTDADFEYSIPFAFVIQGAVLSMLISVLWGVFLSDVLIKKWRFALRITLFAASLLPLLALCFFVFMTIPADWTLPWLLALGGIVKFVIFLAFLHEWNYKKTGERYTQALQQYVQRTQQ